MIIPTAIPRSSSFHPIPLLNRIKPSDSHQFFFTSSSSHRTTLPHHQKHRLLFLRPPLSSSILSTSFKPPSVAAVSESLIQDASATAAVLSGAYFLVLAFDKLTNSGFIEQEAGSHCVRITVHGIMAIVQGSTSFEARYFAAVVPLINSVRLVVNGLSLVTTDDSLVKSVTREGNPRELLKGPLYYVIVLIVSSTVFWRASPVGVVAVAMMCGGDGIADIIGRRYGYLKLPYNPHKSWLGSISMFIFGSVISTGMLYYFTLLGCFALDWSSALQKVVLISLVATLVESLPITRVLDDNLSVPLATMVTALLMFGS